MTKCKHCQVYAPDDYGCCPRCGAPLVPFNACHIGEHGCQRIVINTCYGGFHPSPKAIMRWAELSGVKLYILGELYNKNTDWTKPKKYKELTLEEASDKKNGWYFVRYSTQPLKPDGTIDEDSYWWYSTLDERTFRTDPNFIQAVEELGDEAADETVSEFKIVEIPDEVEWVIEEYDGVEWIAEVHRTWS